MNLTDNNPAALPFNHGYTEYLVRWILTDGHGVAITDVRHEEGAVFFKAGGMNCWAKTRYLVRGGMGAMHGSLRDGLVDLAYEITTKEARA